MAKKQTRRSISVSRTTYERLKAFCETNNISMSQFVETRVGDFLGEGGTTTIVPTTSATKRVTDIAWSPFASLVSSGANGAPAAKATMQ